MALAGMVYAFDISIFGSLDDDSATYLCIAKTFEERSDTDEANVVVPHHCPLLVIAANLEGVLEHFIMLVWSMELSSHCGRLTLEAVSARLHQKVLLVRAVGNMAWICRDPCARKDLELLEMSGNVGTECVMWRKVDHADDLASLKLWSILGLLAFRLARGILRHIV